MNNPQDSAPFVSKVYLSIHQRVPIKGNPDYFVLAKGSYAQVFDKEIESKFLGRYATSFGETLKQVKELLDSFPKHIFCPETLDFKRGFKDDRRKEQILKLVCGHNSRRHLEA